MFEGQDPPRTLSPATATVPQPTKAGPNPTDTAAPSPAGPSLRLETGDGISKSSDPPSAVDPQPKHGDPFPGDPGDPGDPGNFNPPQASLDGQTLQSSYGEPSSSNPAYPWAGGPAADGPAKPGHAEGSGPLPTFPSVHAIDGQIITNGGHPVTISGTPIVYKSGSISVRGQIQPISAGGSASPVVIGGLTFSVAPSAGYTDSNSESDASSAQPNNLPNGNADPTYITIGGQTIAVDPNAIIAAGTTLLPGDPGITINGAAISLGSSVLIVGSRTEIFTPPQSSVTAVPSYISVGGQVIAVDSNAISVAGTTLTPGASAITINGAPISLGSSVLVVGSQTETLSPPQGPVTAAPSYLTVGGEIVTVADSNFIVAGSTLMPGDAAVMADGTPFSLGPSILVVGSRTETLSPHPGPVTAMLSYLRIGGQTINIAASSIVIAGHSLRAGGPAVMVDGTPVSVGSSVLVVGTETMGFTLPAVSASAESSEGIGAMIIYGLTGVGGGIVPAPVETGANSGTAAGNGTVAFMGGAVNVSFPWSIWLWALVICMV